MRPDDLYAMSNIRDNYGDLTELLHSIAMTGVQVPILYYVQGDWNVVKDGHRRLRCVEIINHVLDEGLTESAEIYGRIKQVGLLDHGAHVNIIGLKDITLRGVPITDVPAIEVPAPTEPGEIELFQIVAARDGLRKPLTPMEEAWAISALLNNRSGQQVAEALGKSEAYVSRRHRLTSLHKDFQEAIDKGDLDARAAEQLLTLEDASDPELRKSLIAAKTVRKIRAKVQAANAAAKAVSQEEDVPEMDIDPLIFLQREEVKLAASEAATALRRLQELYEAVDEKPDLSGVRQAIQWISW